ncbi:MAG: Zn-dependent hydrolase [Conexivisphaerales archaeon]
MKKTGVARVDKEILMSNIQKLASIGRETDDGGITRTTFSESDIMARSFISNCMSEAGLKVRIDEFANIIGRLDPYPTTYNDSNSTVIMCGSHIDTVPGGGHLDGAYGVLAGIEALRTIREKKIAHRHPVEVVCFTEEEGARFPAFLGSKGFTGQISKEQAYSLKDSNGVSFLEAMSRAGLTPDKLSVSRYPNEIIGAYLELHIEQGPVLENSKKDIGVVDSIVGLADLEIKVIGKAGHAGTTPMVSRRDALIAASKIIVEVNRIAMQYAGKAVATVGKINVWPNASNVIPGTALLGVDFRSSSISLMKDLRSNIINSAKATGKKEGMKILSDLKLFAEPAKMSKHIMSVIKRKAEKLGYSYSVMPSGAGHDCQNMSKITKTGMIFVPSHLGLSHCKEEYTPPAKLAAGADVLVNSLIELAS